jgi:pyruvate dehydrogenase E1 component alpha subunit
MNEDTARAMLRSLLRIRMIEERIVALYPEQEMRCPTHFSIGQEAVAVAVCAHLSRTDIIASAHRSHAHYLAKGGDLRAMLAELYGKETGCAAGRGGSMHLIDVDAGFLGAVPIVGSAIPIGVGVAFAAHLRGETQLVVIFIGDGAMETGVFHESMNFAVIHKLPIVMICENNLYSVLSPMAVRQPEGRPLTRLAEAHGAFSLRGDGNDVDAAYALAGQAIDHARSGAGPAFIEFATYRWLEHCGPFDDSHLGYRPDGELEAWKARDPLTAYSAALATRGFADTIDTMRADISAEIDAAVAFAKYSPFPDRSTLARYVYADNHAGA